MEEDEKESTQRVRSEEGVRRGERMSLLRSNLEVAFAGLGCARLLRLGRSLLYAYACYARIQTLRFADC